MIKGWLNLFFSVYDQTTNATGVSRTQHHIEGIFMPLNMNQLFFYNHNTFPATHMYM